MYALQHIDGGALKELKQAFEELSSDLHTENSVSSAVGTVSVTPDIIAPRREAHSNASGSSVQTNGADKHPLSDLFGKYEGDIWNEVFAEIDAERQKDTAASQK